MHDTVDITWLHLSLGYFLLLIPIAAFQVFRTGLVRDTLWASVRMTVQLIFVGLYLEYIFRWDHPLINLAWVILMIVIATFTITRRSQLNRRLFFIPVAISLAVSFLIVDGYFLGIVLQLDNLLAAKYFIPITGMIMGNCIRTNVIALNRFFKALKTEIHFFHYSLANGATLNEALLPFVREALTTAFNPTIANMAVMGLIALPGMMTGQILGGSAPMIAIKYQIMLLITIFVSTMVTVLLSLFFSRKFLFDKWYNINPNILRK